MHLIIRLYSCTLFEIQEWWMLQSSYLSMMKFTPLTRYINTGNRDTNREIIALSSTSLLYEKTHKIKKKTHE